VAVTLVTALQRPELTWTLVQLDLQQMSPGLAVVGSTELKTNSVWSDLAQSGTGLTGPIVMTSHLTTDVKDLNCSFLPVMVCTLMLDLLKLKHNSVDCDKQLASTDVN
jgi:hypothetical protein